MTEFNHSRDWLLHEHAVHGGDALIPGTGFLELARAGLSEVADASSIEISRVFFQAPFAVAVGGVKELVLRLQPVDSGWDFRIQSHAGSVTHVSGRVASTSESRPERIDIAAIADRCQIRTEVLDGFLKQPFMDFGRRWGNVRRIQFGRDEALLTLRLPSEYTADLEMFQLHPALLNMATGGAQPLIPGFDATKDFYVPFSYGKLVLWQGFPGRLYSHVRLGDAKGQGLVVFDVTVTDEDGSVLAEISDFAMKRISEAAMIASLREEGGTAAASPVASLAREALRHGIEPEEGVEVFERILACGVSPQVIVSSVDLHLWMRKVGSAAQPKLPTGVKLAPFSGTESGTTTPALGMTTGGDPVERRLAQMYSQLLGVDKVGRRDDFFELGGHSLLAVRLLVQIEKEFTKVIPLPVLVPIGDDRRPSRISEGR